MLKLAGAGLLLFACAGWGFSVSWQLWERMRDLRELRRIAALLRQEISYAGTALPEALGRIAKKVSRPFGEFLDRLAQELVKYPGDSFAMIFAEQVDEQLYRTALEPQDLADFKELGRYLGYLDKEMQLANLDLYLAETEEKLARLTQELPARRKLFQVLGVMAGLFLAVLFL